jgi:hypothetical protein
MEHCEPTDLTKALLEHYKVESKRLKASFPPEQPRTMNNQEKKRFSQRQFLLHMDLPRLLEYV